MVVNSPALREELVRVAPGLAVVPGALAPPPAPPERTRARGPGRPRGARGGGRDRVHEPDVLHAERLGGSDDGAVVVLVRASLGDDDDARGAPEDRRLRLTNQSVRKPGGVRVVRARRDRRRRRARGRGRKCEGGGTRGGGACRVSIGSGSDLGSDEKERRSRTVKRGFTSPSHPPRRAFISSTGKGNERDVPLMRPARAVRAPLLAAARFTRATHDLSRSSRTRSRGARSRRDRGPARARYPAPINPPRASIDGSPRAVRDETSPPPPRMPRPSPSLAQARAMEFDIPLALADLEHRPQREGALGPKASVDVAGMSDAEAHEPTSRARRVRPVRERRAVHPRAGCLRQRVRPPPARLSRSSPSAASASRTRSAATSACYPRPSPRSSPPARATRRTPWTRTARRSSATRVSSTTSPRRRTRRRARTRASAAATSAPGAGKADKKAGTGQVQGADARE